MSGTKQFAFVAAECVIIGMRAGPVFYQPVGANRSQIVVVIKIIIARFDEF